MSYKKVSSRLGVVFAAAALVGCASAEGPADAPAPAGGGGVVATPAMVAEGQTLFAANRCRSCHGDAGVGGRFGPSLTDDDSAWYDPSSPSAMADVAGVIRNGAAEPRIGDSGMPPMGGGTFTDAQINALAAYVLSL